MKHCNSFLRILILIALSMIAGEVKAETASISLNKGWNLVSVPVNPTGSDVASVLSPIDGKYAAVYAYDGSNYETYIPGGSSNTLNRIEAGRGYWLYMNEAATLTVEGSPAPRSVPLKTGWNLVGYNSTQAMAIGEALASIEGKYSAVYAMT
jgi:hypothetical protein